MHIKFKSIILTLILIFSSNIIARDNTEEDLQNISKIYEILQKYHVEEVDHRKSFDYAIKGMVQSLDPYSEYFTPEELLQFNEKANGQFGGIGIVIGKKDDFIQIIAPIDDTPGYRKGLQRGDLITEINGESTIDMSLMESVKIMRGKPGTEVEITILRKGLEPFKVNIVREVITINSIKGYLLEKDIAYIRIASFQSDTYDSLKKNIQKLKKQNKRELKGVILDLRDNPGGLLSSAINISDLFIDGKNIIVSTKGKRNNNDYYSTPGDITNNANIIVLINNGSASASEILAGSLQDLDRATILGSQSYGKGSVQTSIPLSNGYGLKLTTEYFYTTLGKIIHNKGITPDVIFEKNDENQVIVKDKEDEKDDEDKNDSFDTSNLKEKEIIKIQNNIKEKDDKEAISILREEDIIKKAIKILKEKF